MDYCIYDRNDVCAHGCEDCSEYKIRCGICGAEEDVLYDSDGEILCADCFMAENGGDYYADFAEAMNEEFRDYVISANIKNRVYQPDYDISGEDLY